MTGPLRSLPPPSKKRKVQEDTPTVQSIQQLEADLTEAISANASLNPLADLLDLTLATSIPSVTSKGIYAIYRVFLLIISGEKLGLGGDDTQKVVKAWLWDRLNIYVDYLGSLLKDEEKTLRISALQILFSLQKHLSTSYSKSTPSQPQFHISHMQKIVSFILLCPASSRLQHNRLSNDATIDHDVLHHFQQTWFSVHDDIRWFFLREASTFLQSKSPQLAPQLAPNLLSVLEQLETFPTEESKLDTWWVSEMGSKPTKTEQVSTTGATDALDEDKAQGATVRLHKLTIHQSLHSLSSHRAVFTRTWLALLPRISVSDGEGKPLTMRALNVMHRGVLPHLTRPILVMDWVGASVDHGGVVGLLALNALFILMKEYNLDYPFFYTRLYAFIDRDVLHLKHRARFFRMTELFLSSTHLPANLLASFIKRLSRLSLTAPPAAIVMVIPFTYNIIKRHPVLMTMIHRSDAYDASNDPYTPEATDPLNTQAQLSSLWELFSHRSHYHSGVSTLAKIFSETFTKPNYNMEDFLDHTYMTLFELEANRKIKKEPALAASIRQQNNVFPTQTSPNVRVNDGVNEDNSVAYSLDNYVNELWAFA